MTRYSLIHISPTTTDGQVNLRLPDVVHCVTSDNLEDLKALADTLLNSAKEPARQDIFDEKGIRIYRLSEQPGSAWEEAPDGPVNA